MAAVTQVGAVRLAAAHLLRPGASASLVRPGQRIGPTRWPRAKSVLPARRTRARLHTRAHSSNAPAVAPPATPSSTLPGSASFVPPSKRAAGTAGIAAAALALAVYLTWTTSRADAPAASRRLPRADSDERAELTARGPDMPVGASDLISMDEVAKHDSLEKGVWVVIQGQVYDLTEFVSAHPGGEKVILKNAGKDVTDVYMPVHPKNAIQDNLEESQHIGAVDPTTVKAKQAEDLTEREKMRRAALKNLPPVGAMLSLDDFERAAKSILTDQAWAYYCSAGDDEITKHQNRSSYGRIWFKPRILRPVSQVDTNTTIMGAPSTLPFYISPAALAKLGHPDGELNLTRAAAAEGIVQGISANASVGLDEIIDVRGKGQPLVYQLYMNKDRAASERILAKVQEAPSGIRAVLLTVDAPIMGNRESDMRAKGEVVETGGGHGGTAGGGQGVSAAISGYIDPNLTWDIVGWYKKHCRLPLILKGVQSVEDVELAYKHGCSGVILSNHGGRSLDFAPAPIDVLIELQQRRPELLNKLDVYIDGGVRRGTDVLKALALGAKGVGLGRPFLYAQSGFGEAGAQRAIQILRAEIERDMRLLGVTSLRQLGPHMVDVLPRSFDPYLLHRQQERRREYPFEAEQQDAWSGPQASMPGATASAA